MVPFLLETLPSFNHCISIYIHFLPLPSLSLIPFLLPLPSLDSDSPWLVSRKLFSASQPCLWLFQVLFMVLGLSRWSASKALLDKILTAFATTLWRRTFVLGAPWWHTRNSSLIKRLANCCLNYCTERMKWVCKRWQLGEDIFFFFCLKHFYK